MGDGVFSAMDECVEPYFKPRIAILKKLLGNRVIDALLNMPLHTIEKICSFPLNQNDVGKIVTTKVFIECLDSFKTRARKPMKVWAKSGTVSVEIVLFNYKEAYAKKAFPVSSEVYITGKLAKSLDGMLQFINPSKSQTKLASGIFNVYSLSTGISLELIYSVIKKALSILQNSNLEEWIPENILKINNWGSFWESLFKIHNPKENVINKFNLPEYQRLCFDELLAEQLAIRLINPKAKNGNIIKNEKKLIEKLKSLLPFDLTASQKLVIDEIFKDMESGCPMARLLQGDVGSGKTIVAIISALYAIESGYQCALLSPTEVLTRQHLEKIGSYFAQLGIKTEILTANEKGKARKEILYNIASGASKMLIGTHAVFNENVKFENLGLIIIDEQHRFGVNQRLKLIAKGAAPHILSMTATPIPRTLILSQYGDINVSTIREKPFGRKEIISKTVCLSKINIVIESMKNIIEKNQKVYWICPLIEESDKISYASVINRFEYLKNTFATDVELLHGKMNHETKADIFRKFNSGEFHILVATTVIEVGVDVPDATAIIIENAEKFGLAQLHQLRGRVGRSSLQSYCILLYDEKKLSKVAVERLRIIKQTNDGFVIAEKDLFLRGGGETLGTKQSGHKQYQTFNFDDPDSQRNLYPLLSQAAQLANEIINKNLINKYENLLRIFKKDNVRNLKISF
ncbi:MAG: ATP-dependent DNA helicase RecG [Holosporales bacterium]|jgi:ATP-dependent DNA helicase RecG|nr:ATP-dependent DNA helicase RecG [Holosporales bacterium]